MTVIGRIGARPVKFRMVWMPSSRYRKWREAGVVEQRLNEKEHETERRAWNELREFLEREVFPKHSKSQVIWNVEKIGKEKK